MLMLLLRFSRADFSLVFILPQGLKLKVLPGVSRSTQEGRLSAEPVFSKHSCQRQLPSSTLPSFSDVPTVATKLEMDTDDPLNLFQQSLERSSNLPLTIELCNDAGALLPGGRPTKSVEDFLYGGGAISIIDTILKPVRTHLVSLTCLLCGADIVNFLSLQADTFPALERASITFIHTFDAPRSPFAQNLLECLNFTVFENHAALKEATFDILNGINPLDLKLPWTKLMKLNLSRNPISPLLFLRLMRSVSASLVDGAFQIEFPRISHRPLRPRYFDVLMPHLSTLRLKLVNPASILPSSSTSASLASGLSMSSGTTISRPEAEMKTASVIQVEVVSASAKDRAYIAGNDESDLEDQMMNIRGHTAEEESDRNIG
ncbi:hypothetical protein NLJ89_g10535 [Agrocybe chaxingu]|uniref:Uncharacterized protein n=1 Tax=Agrocybe chaxingu TaxID=84603 RepID=A0A9W8JRJ3_9AGAR|nr:hypothetical protein NLJ89_g10535 [Agrocybe chaxingu]